MKLIIYLAIICGICNASRKSLPVYKLLDGNEIPRVGLGTHKTDLKKVETMVTSALESGFRYIDTAFYYGNEKYIGKALKKWFAKGNRRENIFITTKLPPQAMRSSDVESALNISLNKLGLDYVDMYLIHVPFGMKRTADFEILKDENGTDILDFSTDLLSIWKAMEKQARAGRAKSIGLTNFNKTQLLRVWNSAEIKPSNIELETNVYIQQNEMREVCRDLGIVITAYSPLGIQSTNHSRRKRETLDLPSSDKHPVIIKIAEAHNKTAGQVLLRYDLQLNIAVIPRSPTPDRMKENLNIFDFHLSEREMKKIKSLDQHGKYRKFDLLNFTGVEHHPEYPFTDKIPK